MPKQIVYLVEFQPYDPVGATTRNVNFSDNLVDAASLGTSAPYHVRLTQSFSLEMGAFDENIPGGTTVGVGSVTILNSDGAFDYLIDYNWDSRPCVVKRGYEGDAYASYTTIFTGSCLEMMVSGNALVVPLRDNSYKLALPLQTNKYLGTGGAEGTLDLLNRRKPMAFGRVRNAAPLVIDPANLVAQIHDGPVEDIFAAYDKGNKLTRLNSDAASYNALVAQTIPPGYFSTCHAEGLIRLGAKPVGTITVDLRSQYYTAAGTLAALINSVLQGKMAFGAGEIDSTAIGQLGTDFPYPYEGIYLPDPDMQREEFIEVLVASMNAMWYFDRTGKFTVKQFKFRTPTYTVREEDIGILNRDQSAAPTYRVITQYAKNPTVQDVGDFSLPRQTLNGYLKDNVVTVVTAADGTGGTYTYQGEFEVFLNDTKVNDLGAVSFREVTPVSWLTLNADGTFTIADPGGTVPVSVDLEARIGEFFVTRTFTLRKTLNTATPVNLIMTTNNRFFVFDDTGAPAPAGQTAVFTVTGTNFGTPSFSAVDNLGNSLTLTGSGNSRTLNISAIPASPLVFWVTVSAVGNGVTASQDLVVLKGQDGYAAGILEGLAAANSAITVFYQAAAPTGAKVDDLWYDTDDANKVYRWNGSSWVSVSDTRIVDALTQAATAQGTADGKIKTYFGETTPVHNPPTSPLAVGDLWYKGSTRTLYRWDGSNWNTAVGTFGADYWANVLNRPEGDLIVDDFNYFDNTSFSNRWVDATGNATLERTFAQADTTVPGGLYTRFGNNSGNDTGWFEYKGDPVPYDPNALYEMEILVRRTAGASGVLYAGLLGLASDKTTRVARNGTNNVDGHWVVASGVTPTLNAWTLYRGYVKGRSGTGSAGPNPDPSSPGVMQSSVVFIVPVFLVNYNATAGTTDVGYVRLRKVDPTRLGSTILTSAGLVVTDSTVLNSAISIGSNGLLNGAGGGQVTITGLGYVGSLNAGANVTLVNGGNFSITGNSATKLTTEGHTTTVYARDAMIGTAIARWRSTGGYGDWVAGFTSTPTTNPSPSYSNIIFGIHLQAGTNNLFTFVTGTGFIAGPAITVDANTVFTVLYDGVYFRAYASNGNTHTEIGWISTTPGQNLYFKLTAGGAPATLTDITTGAYTQNNWSAIGGTNRPDDGATKNDDGANMIPSPIYFDRAEFGGTATLSTVADPALQTRPLYFKRVVLAALSDYVFPEGNSQAIPVIPNEVLYFSHSVERANAAVAGEYVCGVVQWFRADGGYLSNTGDVSGTKVFSTDLPGGTPKLGKGYVVVPDGAVYCRPYTYKGNGSSTQMLVAEHYLGRSQQGADVSLVIDGPKIQTFEYDYLGTALSGQFPKYLRWSLSVQGTKVTSGVTARQQIKTGNINGAAAGSTWYNMTITDVGQAEQQITSLGATTNVMVVEITYQGLSSTYEVTLNKHLNDPPAGGGGGGGTSTVFNSTSGTSVTGASYITNVDTGNLTVPTGKTALNISYTASLDPSYAKAGSCIATWKLQKWNGASWDDVATQTGATASRDGAWGVSATMEVNLGFSHTGLTAGSTQKYQVIAARTSGVLTADGTGTITVTA